MIQRRNNVVCPVGNDVEQVDDLQSDQYRLKQQNRKFTLTHSATLMRAARTRVAEWEWNVWPIFYPSARWAQRGIVVPFVRRRCRLRRRTHSFGYYTNMVQHIKFIIHTNIQPLPALFFTQGQGHSSKVKVKD